MAAKSHFVPKFQMSIFHLFLDLFYKICVKMFVLTKCLVSKVLLLNIAFSFDFLVFNWYRFYFVFAPYVRLHILSYVWETEWSLIGE